MAFKFNKTYILISIFLSFNIPQVVLATHAGDEKGQVLIQTETSVTAPEKACFRVLTPLAASIGSFVVSYVISKRRHEGWDAVGVSVAGAATIGGVTAVDFSKELNNCLAELIFGPKNPQYLTTHSN
ncbi:hypothetical protein JYT19_00075 [Sulfobacillus acidophilus]|uniref:Uncharacterized protein n=1 Tax=Sulfobacillus acidophilus TaxID=53633 RepID=A0ABS3AW91_9FIRM|nr:hypothetical protein [Sulfobacillus acidophilus]